MTAPTDARAMSEDDLYELKNTKLPFRHRDAEDAMRWAADEITRLRALSRPASVPDGWQIVPKIYTRVKADHPITCLNPTEYFEVAEVSVDSHGAAARGENTCWFNVNMLAASPSPPKAAVTEEMVERAAKAAYESQTFATDLPWEKITTNLWHRAARAALEAALRG